MISVNADWERGYAAGYSAAHRTDVRDLTSADWERGYVAGYASGRAAMDMLGHSAPLAREITPPTPKAAKPKRKASAYSKRYGKMFKRVAPKYKLKNGSWAKDGFKRAQAAAHKLTKK